MGTEFKDEIEGLIDISDAIWGFAEPRFQERESSRIQQEYLSSRGFPSGQIWRERRRRLSRNTAAGSR